MADLLIRGMTLPQSDDEKIIIYSDGIAIKYRCGYGKLIKMMKTVVEIHDHGDLIDRAEPLKKCPEWGYSPRQIKEADTIIPASKEGGA